MLLENNNLGIWNNNGDVNPLKELESINFKDYSGYVWNGFISIKRNDAYSLGLYSKKDYYEYTKTIIPKLIIDSGFNINNVKWYACLHLDSPINFNVHFYLLEIIPTKVKYNERLIPKSAIKAFKSKALNYLINRDELLMTKDNLFMGIIKDVKVNNLTSIDKEKKFKNDIEIKLSKLYKKLPKEHRLQYNSPNLNNVRPLIDEIITDILTSPMIVNDYYKYIEKLHDIDFQNKKYYGESKENNYINNQIHRLYSRIGNDILKNYKNAKDESFLNNQKEFLSNNLLKLNLKTNKNITNEEKLKIGISIYEIAKYANLNKVQTKLLIKKWYIKSDFKDDFNTFYNKLVMNNSNNSLNTSSFYKTLNSMGIAKSSYFKIKQKYYTNVFAHKYLIDNAIKHVMYENERLEKEIVYDMQKNIGF